MAVIGTNFSGLNGLQLSSSYIYQIQASSISYSTNTVDNGISTTTYATVSGSVAGFTQLGFSGTVPISTSPLTPGFITVGQNAYQVYGSTADGANLIYGSVAGPSLGPVYVISGSGAQPVGSLQFNSNNSYVAPTVACFASGTLIMTSAGNVAVEQLKVGDIVITTSGQHVPVQWIGHRTLQCNSSTKPSDAHPVRIAAHAFGDSKPEIDLYVSPGHAIWVPFMEAGVLIPAISLANGSTISQVEAEEVTYWHVELAAHDILLANGLPAESYIDVHNRSFFTSADGYLPPDRKPGSLEDYCCPFFAEGPIVDAVRQVVDSRAAALDARGPLAQEPELLV